MLYRVHRPHDADGKIGSFIGYVHLCHGHITLQHICKTLSEAKIIPEKWFGAHELNMSPATSPYYGVSAYNIVRRTPPKNQLFYLYPIESSPKSDGYTYPTISFGDLTGQANGGQITINAGAGYGD